MILINTFTNHRLATLLCKFYTLASNLHRLTYKDTHRLYMPRLKPHFMYESIFDLIVKINFESSLFGFSI